MVLAKYNRRRKEVRVAVLMSGGVDSSVTAHLLHRRGYEVQGVTLQLFDESLVPLAKSQSVQQSIEDAARICDRMGVPHTVIDLRSDFMNLVVNPYQDTYLAGATPNPCVICNPNIKWGSILERGLLDLGADKLATGHYARVVLGRDGPRLEKGKDRSKDQSYALWGLKREWLAKTLLPLGTWRKEDIRKEAEYLDLPVADKPESQEACFIDDHYVLHLQEMRSSELRGIGKGPIVNKRGEQLGEHQGFFRYTIGQRRGLNIRDGKGPYFVIELRPDTNTVVVGDNKDLFHGGCVMRDVNWLSHEPPTEPERCKVKIRYNDAGGPAMVYPPDKDGRTEIRFLRARRAATPGQSAVWYRGKALWGGGIIEHALEVR